jgi:hypothetical protein
MKVEQNLSKTNSSHIRSGLNPSELSQKTMKLMKKENKPITPDGRRTRTKKLTANAGNNTISRGNNKDLELSIEGSDGSNGEDPALSNDLIMPMSAKLFKEKSSRKKPVSEELSESGARERGQVQSLSVKGLLADI